MPSARFLVSGLVQGVFFRASTQTRARQLSLTGFAKNLADGRVEVIASGEAQALARLHAWLQQGPPAAEVAAVAREELPEQTHADFERR
ncbi:MAG: acylphosphatase [Dokdonella sp.]